MIFFTAICIGRHTMISQDAYFEQIWTTTAFNGHTHPDIIAARMSLVITEVKENIFNTYLPFYHVPRELGQAYVLNIYASTPLEENGNIPQLKNTVLNALFWYNKHEIDVYELKLRPGFELATLIDLKLHNNPFSILLSDELQHEIDKRPHFKIAAIFSTSLSDNIIPVQVLQAYAGRVASLPNKNTITYSRQFILITPIVKLFWKNRRFILKRKAYHIRIDKPAIGTIPALSPAIVDSLSLHKLPSRMSSLRDAATYAKYLTALHAAILNINLPPHKARQAIQLTIDNIISNVLKRALKVALKEKEKSITKVVSQFLLESNITQKEANRAAKKFTKFIEKLFALASRLREHSWIKEPKILLPVMAILRTSLIEIGNRLGTSPSWNKYLLYHKKTLYLPADIIKTLPLSSRILSELGRSNAERKPSAIANKARRLSIYLLANRLYHEIGLILDPSEVAALLHSALENKKPDDVLKMLGGNKGPRWFYAKNMAETIIVSLGVPVYIIVAFAETGYDAEPGKMSALASVYAELINSPMNPCLKEKHLEAFTIVLANFADYVSSIIADLYLEDLNKVDPLGVKEESHFESPLTRAVVRSAIHVISDVDLLGDTYSGKVWSYLNIGEADILGRVENIFLRLRKDIIKYILTSMEPETMNQSIIKISRFYNYLLARYTNQIPSPFYVELYTRVSEQAMLGMAKYAERPNYLKSPYFYELPMDFLGYLKAAIQASVARGIAETIISASMHLRAYLQETKMTNTYTRNKNEQVPLMYWIEDMPAIVANELREKLYKILNKVLRSLQHIRPQPVPLNSKLLTTSKNRKNPALIKIHYINALSGLETVEIPIKINKETIPIKVAAKGYMSLVAVKAFETLYWHNNEIYKTINYIVKKQLYSNYS